MKTTLYALIFSILSFSFPAVAATSGVNVSGLSVDGQIDGENITFTLTFKAEVSGRSASIPLVVGDVAYMESDFPRNAVLKRSGGSFILEDVPRGKHDIVFKFASRPAKDGSWRQTKFDIPMSNIRKLSVECDRSDLEIVFADALSVKRSTNEQKKAVVTAFLGLTKNFNVRWKPEVKQLEAELVVSSDANSIITASVGVMRVDSIFNYRIVQGRLQAIQVTIPKGLNVTQVKGADIQEWSIDEKGESRELMITLSRAQEQSYRFQVDSEQILPKFPTDVSVPVLVPRGVIRASGFVMFGTDNAIKLVVSKAGGLTQVDQAAFPQVALDAKVSKAVRRRPNRSPFVYQYANTPYSLQLSVDDIVPEFSCDERFVLRLGDGNLEFSGSIELDVRDAPTAEVTLVTDADWTVANVSGPNYADHDVKEEGDKKLITVYFKKAQLGRTLLSLRLENSLKEGADAFSAPMLSVKGAKSERGHLAATTDKGLRLVEDKRNGLRDVHTGAVPMKVVGIQHAYRYKSTGWSVSYQIVTTAPVVHADVFHLVSIGDGVLYGSSRINYVVRNAPVKEFRLRIPGALKHVEFVGQDISSWRKEKSEWVIELQEKVSGDYTLLVTYDQPYTYEGQDVEVGGVQTVGAETEVGYIAMSSSGSLKLITKKKSDSVFEIDREEIPVAFVQPVTAPILRSYKYTRTPHDATVEIQRYSSAQLISQVVEFTNIRTRISNEGEAVSTVTYRLKNSSHQYLKVSLPENARLWTTRMGAQTDSALTKVTSLKGSKGEILVPIQRPVNPDVPMVVEVVYAESFGEIEGAGRQVALAAPMVNSDSSFAEWHVEVPDDLAIAEPEANMTSNFRVGSTGLGGVMEVMRVIARVFWDWGLRWLPLMVLGVLVAVGQYVRGRQRGAVVLWVLGCIVMLGAGGLSAIDMMQYHRMGLSGLAQDPITHITFTKSVSLIEGSALGVQMNIVPHWMGSGASLMWIVVPIVIGLVFFVLGIRKNPRGLVLMALGLSGICGGVANLTSGQALVATLMILMAAIIALRLYVKILGHLYQRGVTGFKRQPARAAFVAEPPVPAERTEPRAAEAEFEPSDEHVRANDGEVRIPDLPSLEDPQSKIPSDDEDESEWGLDLDGEDDEPDTNKGGFASLQQLLFCALLSAGVLLGGAFASAKTVKAPSKAPAAARRVVAPPSIVMDRVTIDISGPSTARDAERSAEVVKTLEFKTDKELSFPVLNTRNVLLKYVLGSKYLELKSSPSGYILKVLRKGSYKVSLTYMTPVSEKEGVWSVGMSIHENLRNTVNVTLPEVGLDISSPEAVLFKATETGQSSKVSAVFGSADAISFTWRPRVRKTENEKAVFFCEVNTLAAFKAGVVDLTSLVHYQIAQGELKQIKMKIPKGMNVTAVQAQSLSTWRFDPVTSFLEAVLEKPAVGELDVLVLMQVPSDGLPYQAVLGCPDVDGANKQRGAISISAPATLQVQVGELKGLTAMNNDDFSRTTMKIAAQHARSKTLTDIKRAFRYHALPVSLAVEADAVLPELRVIEEGNISISDERIMLSTRLSVSVLKAGVFSINLDIPDDYDIETLTGEDISHWDDLKESGGGIVVHFNNQATGLRVINMAISRTEKGLESKIKIPRVVIGGARKHTGRLVINGERGVRMTVIDKESDGISRPNSNEVKLKYPGAMVFDLLRPTWSVTLATEVMQPSIKPHMLHRVDLAEGMLKGRVHIQYQIENSGTKTFLLKAPATNVTLHVSGSSIAKVQLVDAAKGLWQVDLHNKQEKRYVLHVAYQMPFDSDRVQVRPLLPVGTEPPEGHLIVMSKGRVEVGARLTPAGLTPTDSRSITADFGEKDLSDAIMCYRTVRQDYTLDLSVNRHGSADVLPATVDSLSLVSVVSELGHMLTEVDLRMRVGTLRFLKMTLPNKNDLLWTVLVNDKVAIPARDKKSNAYRIPLEETGADEVTTVKLVYASRGSKGVHAYKGPRFDLPLTDITWEFYMASGHRYYDFDGSMKYQEEAIPQTILYTTMDYDDGNRGRQSELQQRFKSEMRDAEELRKSGNQKLANKKLSNARNWAFSQADNEDVRIQYRSQLKQQYIVGNLQRRAAVRDAQNIQDDALGDQLAAYNDGNYSDTWGRDVIRNNVLKEDLETQAAQIEKILDQQESAQAVGQAISVAVPRHGTRLVFTRQSQVDETAFMQVDFSASSTHLLSKVLNFWPILIVLVLFRMVLGVLVPACRMV